MQTLLDKVGVIDFKYEKLREQNNFNIFSILRDKSDEVYLHSNFIAELLNPKGSHKTGRVYLDLFLTSVGRSPSDFNKPTVKKEYKDIDILISSGQNAIIVENKIWAIDQDKQLERYYKILKAEGVNNILIIYLTLDGKEPSVASIGDLKYLPDNNSLLVLWSYKNDVSAWLDACLKETVQIPAIRETLIQYKNLIGELTGNSMTDGEKTEIANLLSMNNNIFAAEKIVANWNYVKVRTEWNFWKELQEMIVTEYPDSILTFHQVTWSKIKDVVDGRRVDQFYGIIIKIKQIGEYIICLCIERGNKSDLYYGIIVTDAKGNRSINNTTKCDALAELIKGSCTIQRSENWIGRRNFEPTINFSLFQNDATLSLAKPDDRKKYIQENWNIMNDFIKGCSLETYNIPFN